MGEPEPTSLRSAASVPALDVFDPEQTKTLSAVLERAQAKAEVLIGLVHADRELASAMGIEGIAIEVLAIQGSERFVRVKDALEEAARTGASVTLTHDGLGKLHRLEALVSEGEQQLSRFTESGGKVLSGRRRALAQASSTDDLLFFGAIFALGAVAITLAVALVGKALPAKEPARRPFFDGRKHGS